MGLIAWIIIGALAGWIASMIVGNNEEQGAIGNIFFGIIGAIVGGFIASLLGAEGVTGFNLYTVVIAILGATLVIYLKEKITS